MRIPIKKLTFIIFLTIFLLLSAHILIIWLGPRLPKEIYKFLNLKFHVDKEANIPTWFSASILLLISSSAMIISVLKEKSPKTFLSDRIFWLITSITFAFLSLDELAQIHEIIDVGSKHQLKWVLFYIPFAAIFLILCLYYFLVISKDKALSSYFLGGFIILIAGGMGMELISSYLELSYIINILIRTTEEGLEMLGTSIILLGCLHELNNILAIYQKEVSNK